VLREIGHREKTSFSSCSQHCTFWAESQVGVCMLHGRICGLRLLGFEESFAIPDPMPG
jgi:hypothetical protein